jgi:hypothetical protein
LKNGFLAGVPNSKQAFFWEAAGEMAIVIAFCILILLKNPLALAFCCFLLLGRFQAGKKPIQEDFEHWYPATAW